MNGVEREKKEDDPWVLDVRDRVGMQRADFCFRAAPVASGNGSVDSHPFHDETVDGAPSHHRRVEGGAPGHRLARTREDDWAG